MSKQGAGDKNYDGSTECFLLSLETVHNNPYRREKKSLHVLDYINSRV